jgi:hypothetical protein
MVVDRQITWHWPNKIFRPKFRQANIRFLPRVSQIATTMQSSFEEQNSRRQSLSRYFKVVQNVLRLVSLAQLTSGLSPFINSQIILRRWETLYVHTSNPHRTHIWRSGITWQDTEATAHLILRRMTTFSSEKIHTFRNFLIKSQQDDLHTVQATRWALGRNLRAFVRWLDRKTPNLIKALRPDKRLYNETLGIFYKNNIFTFHRGNGWSWGDMTKQAVLRFEKVKIFIEYVHQHFYEQNTDRGTYIDQISWGKDYGSLARRKM